MFTQGRPLPEPNVTPPLSNNFIAEGAKQLNYIITANLWELWHRLTLPQTESGW